jgi:Uri superfamily endonuclease
LPAKPAAGLPYTASGSYLLIIRLDKPARIQVGRKGLFRFPAGWYVYAGSAKRGLRARIERHLRRKKKMRWHIDYLLRRARILYVITFADRTECELAALLLARGGRIVVPRFGSSDCRCPSHLVYFPRRAVFGNW